jgi:hypothetical protein
VGKGKDEQVNRPGPKRKFNGQNRQCIKRAAEAMKAEGLEPTVDAVRERATKATVNPDTGEFYDKKLILDVFKNDCYDPGARHPWGHLTPISKAALSPTQILARFQYSKDELELGHDAAWYHRNCVWVDPNFTILTDEPRAIFDEKQATKGKQKKRWCSPDKRYSSRNLRASSYAVKQTRYGDRKVWWHTVVSRGVVHFEVMGADWDQMTGQPEFIDRLERILHRTLT